MEYRELGPSSFSWLPAQSLQLPMDLMGSCWLLVQVVPQPWPSDPPYMTLGPVSCGDGEALDTTVLSGFERLQMLKKPIAKHPPHFRIPKHFWALKIKLFVKFLRASFIL